MAWRSRPAGCASRSAARPCWTASAWRSWKARYSRCSARTGRASPPRPPSFPPPTPPTPARRAGPDPRSRRRMWQIVGDLVAAGTTVFLTTQYLEEADELADRIAVLDNGHLVAAGTADELKRLVPGGHVRLRFAGPDDLAAASR